MTEEIERTFLPHTVPDPTVRGPGTPLRQGHLAEDRDIEVRVRLTATDAVLTIKAGSGLTRTEIELLISDPQAAALWPHTSRRRIERTRYRVPLDDPGRHIADIDIYDADLTGLCVIEVELDSADDAAAFAPPPWFGRDITGQLGWSNAMLARHGRPRPASERLGLDPDHDGPVPT